MINLRHILRGARLAAVLAAALAISACANNKPPNGPQVPAPRRRRAASRTSWSMSATASSSRPTRPSCRRSPAPRSTSRRSGSTNIRNTPSSIEGNADERGTREYNLALGARRAQVVRDYLVSRGVAATRMSTISYGKERPVATCDDISCWSQNRRAVTALHAGGVQLVTRGIRPHPDTLPGAPLAPAGGLANFCNLPMLAP